MAGMRRKPRPACQTGRCLAGRRRQHRRAVSLDPAAHCRRPGPVAGAHQQNPAQAGTPWPHAGCHRPGPPGRPLRRRQTPAAPLDLAIYLIATCAHSVYARGLKSLGTTTARRSSDSVACVPLPLLAHLKGTASNWPTCRCGILLHGLAAQADRVRQAWLLKFSHRLGSTKPAQPTNQGTTMAAKNEPADATPWPANNGNRSKDWLAA